MELRIYYFYVSSLLDFLQEFMHIADEGVSAETMNIIVVTHGNFILTLLRFLHERTDRFTLINFDERAATDPPRNTGVYRFTIEPVLPSVNRTKTKRLIRFNAFNEHAHL
jgi:broad specificity phosphatase PhoE